MTAHKDPVSVEKEMKNASNVLTVAILQTQVMEPRVGANYFILGKLMQANEQKNINSTQKLRTDIAMNAGNTPLFIKNKMHFKDFDSLSTQNKITLELQLYIAPQSADNDVHVKVADKLISESIYLGSATHQFNPSFLHALKQDFESP